ncbi:MAG: hypothetical protein PVSMB7_07490 [Chloroflexota bacterium]
MTAVQIRVPQDAAPDRQRGTHAAPRAWVLPGIVCAVLFALDLYGVESGASVHADRSLDLMVHGWFGHPTFGAFGIISALGGAALHAVVLTLIVAALVFHNRWRHAVVFLSAVLGGELLNLVAKDLIARPRPHLFAGALSASGYSFPSGHAMGSMVFFGALIQLSWALTQRRAVFAVVAAVSVLLTGLIGLSRVVLGVHYPTDVAAGYALGLAWLTCVFLAASREHRFPGEAST